MCIFKVIFLGLKGVVCCVYFFFVNSCKKREIPHLKKGNKKERKIKQRGGEKNSVY